mmetsp:Transcript_53239/g.140906  ORF Transcript_53239/g.140906 Transcript_53239/m.140906 type:complete len:566 (-) Transcript_53239:50-1747(-)
MTCCVSASSTCDSCSAGMFSSSTGASSCLRCLAGSFSSLSGSAACIPCKKGQFQPLPSTSVCSSCPEGYFSNVTGATSSNGCRLQDKKLDIALIMRSSVQYFNNTSIQTKIAGVLSNVLDLPSYQIAFQSLSFVTKVRQLQNVARLQYVATTDSSAVQAILSRNDVLGSLNSILDLMSIPSASSIQMTPEPEQGSREGPNVGLIVGCVIGGLALVAIIVFVLYWQHCYPFSKKEEEELKPDQDSQHQTALVFNEHHLETADLLSKGELELVHRIAGGPHEEMNKENRLFERPYVLRIGTPVEAAKGLESRMNVTARLFRQRCSKGVDGIVEEVQELVEADPKGAEVLEWLNYILYEPTSERTYNNGVRDEGRGSVDLDYFVQHPKAVEAELTKEEVVALRLYTTHAYTFMNGPLRDDERHKQGRPCPLPVATSFAAAGIKKLRALNVEEESAPALWRGMRNMDFSHQFVAKGGTEMAFMSTTTNLEVALRYSLSANSLLFKLSAGSFLAVGADVQWLSAFPHEAEVLYPPLTFLQPTGRQQLVECRGQGGTKRGLTFLEVVPTIA